MLIRPDEKMMVIAGMISVGGQNLLGRLDLSER